MGYILPIENYQYQIYQNRVTNTKSDPFQIERVYAAQLDLANNEEELQENNQFDAYPTQQSANTSYTKINEKIYANITGKGRLFNVNI